MLSQLDICSVFESSSSHMNFYHTLRPCLDSFHHLETSMYFSIREFLLETFN